MDKIDKLVVRGGKQLSGNVKVHGSKNASLPLLAATLLADTHCTLAGIPRLIDIDNMLILLENLNTDIQCTQQNITLVNSNPATDIASYETANKLRASFLVAGPLLARAKRFRISLPGGCQIGARPIDLHLKGFKALGASVSVGHGYVEACCDRLVGSSIYLDFPSVGATENIMMLATCAEGVTTIENAAAEPEIIDLASFINAMGGRVSGAGTDKITIHGMHKLHGVSYNVIPDRIEAGTFMVAAAITHGKVKVENCIPHHLKPVIAKLREMGAEIAEEEDSVTVDASGAQKSVDVKTLPFPGFPTDMQQSFSSLLCVVQGTGVIVETVFENRFTQVPELMRMGAQIKIDGRAAIIEGGRLSGAKVKSTDLRGGASLVLAGLAAQGETTVDSVRHIDRGYYKFDEKLQGLGADVCRV